MLINVKLIGDGTDKNTYRANLPTYRLVTVDYEKKVAIVDVPQDTLGLTDDDLRNEEAFETTEGDLYMRLSPESLEKVKQHLAHDYPNTSYAVETVSE